MRILPLILGVSLSACAAQQSTGLAPLVTRVTHTDRLFQVTWDAQHVSATLSDSAAVPPPRMLLGLGISVIERATKCAVIDARLPDGALTISALIDCTTRSVVDI
ncbi:MAG: hypothetical protein ACJAVR_000237 [Paracoccaceae bacterium]|jgi:hypothetical protein